jgi:hypothetical protein
MDIQVLCNLPLVREQFAELGAGSDADLDVRRDAIEQALAAAIKSLPDPFYIAALEHFGLEDKGEKPLGKVAREERAAAVLERSHRWYVEAGRSNDYLGMTPSRYVIALVTFALCGNPDPITDFSRLSWLLQDIEAEEPPTVVNFRVIPPDGT